MNRATKRNQKYNLRLDALLTWFRPVPRTYLFPGPVTLVFETQPDADLFCPICSDILREACCPSHCGHLFCDACLKQHFDTNGGTCPVCREA